MEGRGGGAASAGQAGWLGQELGTGQFLPELRCMVLESVLAVWEAQSRCLSWPVIEEEGSGPCTQVHWGPTPCSGSSLLDPASVSP